MDKKFEREVFRLLKDVKTLAVVCYQWGDTGKGKFVDLFAHLWADIIVRGTGGANAGHTIEINGKKYVFHLIPSGILHDEAGKVNVIGRGVVFDPRIMMEEMEILEKEGMSYKNLMISQDAKLVLPQHLVVDKIKEIDNSGKIGTTGRGIGPAYVDHIARCGLIVNDLLNKDIFYSKLKNNLQEKKRLLSTYNKSTLKGILAEFYSEKDVFDIDMIIDKYCDYGKKLKDFIRNTDEFLRMNVGKKNILLEGAQGFLLSIDYGTYPYVTSSDSSYWGLAHGSGLPDGAVDLVLGIVKAFYETRVGEGPFPTEIGWVKSANPDWQYPNMDINAKNPYLQGVGIRKAGNEYGATTGRPRRVGWLDLPLLRYAAQHSGPNVILTKLDVLSECKIINICEKYRYVGKTINVGQDVLSKGSLIRVAIPAAEILQHCKPIYCKFEGWQSDISGILSLGEMPENFKTIYNYIVKEGGISPRVLSVGADRNATIFV